MKIMQFIIFAIGIFATILSCDDNREEAPIEDNFGEPITLKLGEAADIQADVLSIAFDELVEDSRCPTGAECFWEGQATVRFSINKTTTLELISRAGHEELAKDTLDNYVYTLLKVSPYPDMKDMLPIPADSYTVEVQVDKF